MDGINYKALLHRVKVDKDGECEVTMKVSLSCRKDILTLAEWTEKVLDVNVVLEPEPDKVIAESQETLNSEFPDEVSFE